MSKGFKPGDVVRLRTPAYRMPYPVDVYVVRKPRPASEGWLSKGLNLQTLDGNKVGVWPHTLFVKDEFLTAVRKRRHGK